MPEPAPGVCVLFYFIFWLPGGGSAIIDLLIEIDFENPRGGDNAPGNLAQLPRFLGQVSGGFCAGFMTGNLPVFSDLARWGGLRKARVASTRRSISERAGCYSPVSWQLPPPRSPHLCPRCGPVLPSGGPGRQRQQLSSDAAACPVRRGAMGGHAWCPGSLRGPLGGGGGG